LLQLLHIAQLNHCLCSVPAFLSLLPVCCALSQLDVALEIIGERSLRIEELEEDIHDMKSIFHAQLDEAARKLEAAEQQQQADGGGA
jgi:hypothetical protein